jgi:predicted metalloprotease
MTAIFSMRFVHRVLALAALGVALAAAAFTDRANALNPEQTSVTNIVNIVYWDLDAYWRPSRRSSVGYYDYFDRGVLIDFATPCGNTTAFHGAEGFYCPGNEAIYFDFIQQVGNVSTFGDGSTTLWMAHEYGHHMQRLLGINWRNYAPYHELLADCFAGMYIYYGIHTSRKLNANDYGEARNQIWALPDGDQAHGTRLQRLRAFDFGFGRSRDVCINGAGVNY